LGTNLPGGWVFSCCWCVCVCVSRVYTRSLISPSTPTRCRDIAVTLLTLCFCHCLL
jgi:hypothetical protein